MSEYWVAGYVDSEGREWYWSHNVGEYFDSDLSLAILYDAQEDAASIVRWYNNGKPFVARYKLERLEVKSV